MVETQRSSVGTVLIIFGVFLACFSFQVCGVYVACIGTYFASLSCIVLCSAKKEDMVKHFTDIMILLFVGLFLCFCGFRLYMYSTT